MEISAVRIGKHRIGVPVQHVHAGAGFRMGSLIPFPGYRTIIERIAQIRKDGFCRQLVDDDVALCLCRRHSKTLHHENQGADQHEHQLCILLHVNTFQGQTFAPN